MTIEVECGSMFSGKTLEMIGRTVVLEKGGLEWGIDYIIFNHAADNRYGENVIAAHTSGGEIRAKAIAASDSFELLEHICEWNGAGWELKEEYAELRQLFIDEGQFFDEGLVGVVDYIDRVLGIDVVIAGLDTDFRGEPFPGPMPGILAIADKVEKHHAGCQCGGKCDERATRTQRIIDGQPAGYHDEVFMVGAKEAYEARCKKHQKFRDGDSRPIPFADRFSK